MVTVAKVQLLRRQAHERLKSKDLSLFALQGGDKVSLIDKDENNIRTESLTKVGFRSFYKIVNKKKYATRISCGKMILG